MVNGMFLLSVEWLIYPKTPAILRDNAMIVITNAPIIARITV
jgi:hypothetical protein